MVKTAQRTGSRLNINLLYPQGIMQKLPIRFIKWLISYGRFIVVVVEIFVLATFLYRFKLDADLATLNEKINDSVQYIENLSEDEALIKQTQLRLSIIKKVYSASSAWQNNYTKISAQTPVQVKFTNLSTEKTESGFLQFKIVAQTNNISDVALFLKGLKESKGSKGELDFADISLTNISFEQGLIEFNISGRTR